MVVVERLGERLDGRLRQNFETVEDLLAVGFDSGCAAAGCDYDCAAAERILEQEGKKKFEEEHTLLGRSTLLRRTRKTARIHEVLGIKRRRVAIRAGLMHEAFVWHSIRVGRTRIRDELLV